MEIRTKLVVFYEVGVRSAKEIYEIYYISEKTVRRRANAQIQDRENGLRQKKIGPTNFARAIPMSLEQRITRLKENYSARNARRITYQFNVS